MLGLIEQVSAYTFSEMGIWAEEWQDVTSVLKGSLWLLCWELTKGEKEVSRESCDGLGERWWGFVQGSSSGVRSGKILNIFWGQSQEDFLNGYEVLMGESRMPSRTLAWKIGRMREGGQLFFKNVIWKE